MGLLIGFAPWIIFWVFAGETFRFATVGAFVSAIVVNLPALLQRRLKLLDIGTLLFFALLAVAAFTIERTWFERFANPLSNGALALIAFVSIVLRQPFTLQYARETTPAESWNAPAFIRAGYLISGVWCASFVIQTISTLIAAIRPSDHVLFRYLIPYGSLVLALAYTRWYIYRARHPAARTHPPS
jgi:hypothetical protein